MTSLSIPLLREHRDDLVDLRVIGLVAVVDHPHLVYASPVGNAFAYCDDV